MYKTKPVHCAARILWGEKCANHKSKNERAKKQTVPKTENANDVNPLHLVYLYDLNTPFGSMFPFASLPITLSPISFAPIFPFRLAFYFDLMMLPSSLDGTTVCVFFLCMHKLRHIYRIIMLTSIGCEIGIGSSFVTFWCDKNVWLSFWAGNQLILCLARTKWIMELCKKP